MAASGPLQDTCQSTFESAVAMSLHLWQPLSFAVESNLGGGDGADKRDWFAGAVAELFDATWAASASAAASPLSADDLLMDVEARLLQIMEDEFDTIVDDGTAYDVARQIVSLWTQCRRGDFTGASELQTRWEASRGKRVAGLFRAGVAPDDDSAWKTEDEDEDDEDEDEDDEGDDAEEGADVTMDEAPEKAHPQVDEDGFTTVTRRRR